jgi:hypothetical protein
MHFISLVIFVTTFIDVKPQAPVSRKTPQLPRRKAPRNLDNSQALE